MPEIKATVEGPDTATSSASATSIWPFAAMVLFLGLLWLEAINQLKAEWSLNPQYGYGWSVPPLICYLLWKRWSERPAPGQPFSLGHPIIVAVFCALLFFPVRFVAEANPDWRLLSWSVALIAVAISICLIFLTGGRPWVRYFAFPFFFFLVAVPWPTRLEELIIQGLMRAVSATNVTLVNAIGIPAVQHGNVIEITSGFVGIEEACSGVRSLQGALMISLFLGELFSFRLWPRFVLVVAGAALAFFCNIIRTAVLVCIGASRGIHAIEGWHDPAGVIILLFCLLGLWVLGGFAICRLPEFALGMSLAMWHTRSTARVEWFLLRGAGFVVGLILYPAALQLYHGVYNYIFVDFATGACCMLEIVGIAGIISLLQEPAKLFGLVGIYSYGLYLIHQPYVIWLGLRIREQPIWMFLLISVATLAVLSAWGMLLEKATNTLVNKLLSSRKPAYP